MAKLEKAQITYEVDGKESVLRFHSVISEEHSISTEITKFPTQASFSVSNHAIKKNKRVSISGVVSNHLIVGAVEAHQYDSSGNNSRVMFSALSNLVRAATPCEVVTNYGNYSPVIFDNFKTKLQAGKTDIMEFTLSGQEVQIGSTIIGTSPTLLIFTPLTETERVARVTELKEAGLDVKEDAVIEEAPVDFNKSFQVETKGTNGEILIITYENIGYDSTSGIHKFKVHTSDTAVEAALPKAGLDWFSMIQEDMVQPRVMVKSRGIVGLASNLWDKTDLMAGAATAGACLTDGLVGLGKQFASDQIDSAMGKVTKSIYGAAYDMFGVNGDTGLGQVLLSLGVDCLVAGAVGSIDPNVNPDSFNNNNLPSWDEALEGAAGLGDSVITTTAEKATSSSVMKVIAPDGTTSLLGDLLG